MPQIKINKSYIARENQNEGNVLASEWKSYIGYL